MGGPKEIWFLVGELVGQTGGGLRQERWCRLFLRRGYEATILNPHGAFRITRASIETEEGLTGLRKEWVAGAPAKPGVRQGIVAKVLRRIKHLTLIDLFYPNSFSLAAILIAKVSLRKGPVTIMCSSPPFALALIGATVKAAQPDKVRLLIDMRDPWALHKALGGSRKLKIALERWVLSQADRITNVSNGMRRQFETAYGLQSTVLYNVATHYQSGSPAPVDLKELSPDIRAGSAKLVYTGSVPEGYYDLDGIISALRCFAAERSDAADRIQLVFIGASEELRRRSLRYQELEGLLVFISQLPQDTVRRAQASADGVIFLAFNAPDNAGQVSIKLFEYMELQKPILPISVRQGSDVDYLIETYCGYSPRLSTPDDILRTLRRIADEGVAFLPRTIDTEKVRAIYDDYQAFVESLDSSPLVVQ